MGFQQFWPAGTTSYPATHQQARENPTTGSRLFVKDLCTELTYI